MNVQERIFVYALFFLLFHATKINDKEGCDRRLEFQTIIKNHVLT